jgi:hypothetical protein
LFFAEKPFNGTEPGDRKFAVEIEGIRVLDNFDISAEVGDGTIQQAFQVLVQDGFVDIEFVRQVSLPLICGIEISSLVPVAPAPEFELFEGKVESGITQGSSVYPNPFEDRLILDFLVGENDENLQFTMRNMAGQLIYAEDIVLQKGQYSLELDFSEEQIAPGIYLIWMETESYPNQFAKVIKK